MRLVFLCAFLLAGCTTERSASTAARAAVASAEVAVAPPVVKEPPPAPCEHAAVLHFSYPKGRQPSFMIPPEPEEDRERAVASVSVATTERLRIEAAIASVLDAANPPHVWTTGQGDGKYRVEVEARIVMYATCHGRYDALHLSGTASVHGDTVDVTLSVRDDIVEDVCSNGARSRSEVGRTHATASLRITPRC